MSPTLEKLSANCLESKINTFIENHQDLQLSQSKIIQIMNLYKAWNVNKDDEDLEFSRRVLYFVFERMYWSEFAETQYVKALLNFLFEIDEHLYIVIMDRKYKCSSLDQVATYDLHDFFICHAYEQKLLFDSYRLPCLKNWNYRQLEPKFAVQLAVLRDDPFLLRQMLRYGAMLSYYKKCMSEPHHHILFSLEYALCRILKLNPNLVTLKELRLTPLDMIRYKKILLNCNLLSRDILPIFNRRRMFEDWYVGDRVVKKDLVESYGFDIFERKNDKVDMCEEDITDLIEKVSHRALPNFKKHFIMPVDLKEVCRLRIRTMLNNNCMLPEGIYSLPIPKMLMKYLDVLDTDDLDTYYKFQ